MYGVFAKGLGQIWRERRRGVYGSSMAEMFLCASSWRPIDSLSAVCALRVMASMKSATSRIDFSAFQTSQNTIASTFPD